MLLAAVLLLLLPHCMPEVVQHDIFSFGWELLSKGIFPAILSPSGDSGRSGFP